MFYSELKRTAHNEAYTYYQSNIDPSIVLVLRPDGFLASTTTGADDSLDAFRHAYVSGVFALETFSSFAFALGVGLEMRTDIENEGGSPESRAMDLFNNGVGRDIAGTVSTRAALADGVKAALENGQLITSLGDAPAAYGVEIVLQTEDGFQITHQIVDGAFADYLGISVSANVPQTFVEIIQTIIDNYEGLTEETTVEITQGGSTKEYHVYSGTENADIVSFASNVNVALLGAGDDSIGANNQASFIDGGDGVDTINYTNVAAGVTIDLAAGETRYAATNAVEGNSNRWTLDGHTLELSGTALNDTMNFIAANDSHPMLLLARVG